MKRLSLFLILLARLSLGAQEVVTLDQSLGFSYNSNQVSMGALNASSATTQAHYQFGIGLPILAYRLGALNLGGGIGYLKQVTEVKQSGEARSDSALGLNTFGVSGSLFPYQPYHLSFDYSHSKSPDIFDAGVQTSESFGLGLMYRSDWVQNLQLAYRHGRISGINGGGRFSSWTLSDSERRGNTDIRINADRQDASYGTESALHSTTLTVNTQTNLKGPWSLSNNVSTMEFQGSTLIQAGSALTGTYGAWTSMSSLEASYSGSQGQAARSAGLSQSLARAWGPFSLFSQLGVSGGSSSGEASRTSTMGHLIVGGTYKVSQNWNFMADISGAWSRTPASSGRSLVGQGPTKSMHVGATWGGGIPELLKHAMFYWTNLRFQRRLEEDYPPGYLPPEMAQVQVKRRQAQQGSMQFSADVYRVDNGGQGRQDWIRVQGGLNFPNGLMLQTVGDLRKDDHFSTPDASFKNAHLRLNGAYGLGRTFLTFSLGYSSSTIEEEPLQWAPQGELRRPGGTPAKVSHFFALGANSNARGMPIGVTVLKNIDVTGLTSTSLLTFASSSFGKTSFSINYQHGRRSDGLRSNQVSVNLGRWFDTIALWGFGD